MDVPKPQQYLTPEHALEQIQALLSKREWNADTLGVVAEVLADAGYSIEDFEGHDND